MLLSLYFCFSFEFVSFPSNHEVPPQITHFEFGDEPANVGEVASVTCSVARGDLPVDIFWSLNMMPVVSGEHSFTVLRPNGRTSILSVDWLDAQHRGTYRCMARNVAGQAEHEAQLHVNGVYSNILYQQLLLECF